MFFIPMPPVHLAPACKEDGVLIQYLLIPRMGESASSVELQFSLFWLSLVSGSYQPFSFVP